MRLIDGTIQALPLTNYVLERKEAFVRALEKGDNDFLFAMMMDYFDSQPTAYDIDKVVAELEELANHYHKCCLADYNEGAEVGVRESMAIVRKGGVE